MPYPWRMLTISNITFTLPITVLKRDVLSPNHCRRQILQPRCSPPTGIIFSDKFALYYKMQQVIFLITHYMPEIFQFPSLNSVNDLICFSHSPKHFCVIYSISPRNFQYSAINLHFKSLYSLIQESKLLHHIIKYWKQIRTRRPA